MNLYGKADRSVARSGLWSLWTELCVGLPHELWFQDEAAAPVESEESVVQVHLQPGRLEVQRHCTTTQRGGAFVSEIM